MFAIVDIETTGGYASNNDITEVAIVLHDGQTVTGSFESLVYTPKEIPRYIQALTGITPSMLEEAPTMEELAPRIYNLLQDRIFVAHNVNFDYSFIKHQLAQYGFELDCQRLCTVRLSRQVFPGLHGYGLGKLCARFDISNERHHRAGGDARATARLFDLLLENNAWDFIRKMIMPRSAEQSLPPQLPAADIEQLPYQPGVYYFHDQKGKIIYVGKAKNLRYRVRSHFSNNGGGRQRQNFLRHVHRISFQSCGTELMAFILESVEIKKHWPAFNRSQKRATARFALYCFEDGNGYCRLAIDRKRKNLQALYQFDLLVEGHRVLRRLISQYGLCQRLCYIQKDRSECEGLIQGSCQGACRGEEPPALYNARVQEAIRSLGTLLPSMAIIDEGMVPGQQSCILMEKGQFYGMGYIPENLLIANINSVKPYLNTYPETDYIRGLILNFAERWPDKVVDFRSALRSTTPKDSI